MAKEKKKLKQRNKKKKSKNELADVIADVVAEIVRKKTKKIIKSLEQKTGNVISILTPALLSILNGKEGATAEKVNQQEQPYIEDKKDELEGKVDKLVASNPTIKRSRKKSIATA
ncbi:MAG: hypothetical protein M3Q05_00505 [Bacteroidota bacterium]|nr:hypothetical protein [Bacteroidota bacterium]